MEGFAAVFYWFLKTVVLGPILKLLFRPWVEGGEHVPDKGAAILASNHLSFSDSIFLPLALSRRITFPAKMEYFTGSGIKGRLTRWFFKGVGQIPIDRSGGRASEAAIQSGLKVLRKGELFGIYPEGTRSPDGRLYKGKTGLARMALEAKCPVIPVAMIGTDKAQPTGQKVPTIMRIGIRIGKPLDFSRYEGMENDRFVLRSINQVQAIKSALPQLITALPQTVVVSVNIHPEHKAVLEGEEEIVLTPRHTLPMTVNGVTLHLRPKSFFQTNTEVAASLYRQAREWVNDLQPGSVWDLYCGVGGFALHLAAPGRAVVGVEIAPDAIVSARQSATEAGADVRFVIGDATAYAQEHPAAELIVVNPPRRGLGPDLAATIERSEARHLVYSSCNVDSLARDLAMLESFTVTEARVFDMFPQTHHQEVMLVASRKGRG